MSTAMIDMATEEESNNTHLWSSMATSLATSMAVYGHIYGHIYGHDISSSACLPRGRARCCTSCAQLGQGAPATWLVAGQRSSSTDRSRRVSASAARNFSITEKAVRRLQACETRRHVACRRAEVLCNGAPPESIGETADRSHRHSQ